MKELLRVPYLNLMDLIFSTIPHKKPSQSKLENIKIIAHRGWHNDQIRENTMTSFDKCIENGIWGVEFDIRWTKDLVPIVHHDQNCQRVFGKDINISETDFLRLREMIPDIPTFSEVVKKYAGKIHLIIELKLENYSNIEFQKQKLAEILSNLTPKTDYHLLGIGEAPLRGFDNFPNDCKILVGDTNMKELANSSIVNNYSGVAGHFTFINEEMINELHKSQQFIGSAYICSKNSLYRELNRDIDHIYTNHPWKILPYLSKK